MSRIINLSLILAVVIYFCNAQMNATGQQCLCTRVRKSLNRESGIKDMQLYRATNFCNKIEIVITMNNNLRYCLDTNSKAGKTLSSFMKTKAHKAASTVSSRSTAL